MIEICAFEASETLAGHMTERDCRADIAQYISDLADFCRSNGLQCEAARLERISEFARIELQGGDRVQAYVSDLLPETLRHLIEGDEL